jgi:hypothetical protein
VKHNLLGKQGFLFAHVIFDIFSSPVPPDTSLLGLFSTITKNPHSMVVKGIGFYKINEVQSVGLPLFDIANSKVKPLGHGSARTMVELQIEVIFKLLNLSRFMQVS